MDTSRRRFLQKFGLAALGVVPTVAAVRALAQEGAGSPPNVETPTGGLPVMKALPVTPDYEVSAHYANSGPGFGRRVALTFDDGPAPTTPLVLEELSKRNIKATFFMLGQQVKAFPSIAREVLDAGHEIGNHSFTHPQLARLPEARVVEEIQGCQDMIQSTLGVVPDWFRPPYGSFRKDQGSLASSRRLGVIFWSVDPNDWRKPGVNVVVQRVLTETGPGSVVLLHDIHKSTCDAVPAILDGLIDRGFEFTNVSGFLGKPYPA